MEAVRPAFLREMGNSEKYQLTCLNMYGIYELVLFKHDKLRG